MEIKSDFIRIAGEKEVSKTIEELLEINKLLGKRSKEYSDQLQEGQLANTENRFEAKSLTEKQLKDCDNDTGKQILDKWKDPEGIVEIRLNDNKNDQRRPENGESTEEMRGHKNISKPMELVYRQEDDRKKLDKGQLDKKRSK